MKSIRRILICCMVLLTLPVMDACKAKSCDASNNVAEENRSRKKKKNLGLFSNKERRKKRW